MAHRVAWAAYRTTPFDMKQLHGKIVMHTCDNPGCVNPKHLRLGTQSDNCLDRERKGRGSRDGVAAATAAHTKLTPEQVLAIRAEAAAVPRSHRRLGREYGVVSQSIDDIVSRKNWGWLS